ncbi:MAG: NAD-dependent epimerase/dehydratase family protein [Planctomycetota bacterium]
MSGKCFIVTGGAGFIGSNVCASLTERYPSSRVVVIDDFRSGAVANLIAAYERRRVGAFTGEVLPGGSHEHDWSKLIGRYRPDVVFHLGAITDTTVLDESEMLRVNVGGFGELLRSSMSAGARVVYASSAATYGSPDAGDQRRPFTEDLAGRPNNVYGFSKWLMEAEHSRVSDEIGADAPIVGLRYFNVFGPGESTKGKMASMARQLALQLLGGNRPRLFTPGDQARDQVHVDDVVGCTLAAGGIGGAAVPTPGVYNCGSGAATSFNAVADAVREGLGMTGAEHQTEFFEMPETIAKFYQAFTQADLSRTTAALGWAPAIEPAEGVRSYAALLGESWRERGEIGAGL